ncbi:MAG: hypothetical protein WBO45_06670 [Planctomycetota bacterium]
MSQTADRWLARLLATVQGLEHWPRRYPIAREAFACPDLAPRQILFGRVRILFVIEGNDLYVVHARHASRSDAARDDMAREAQPCYMSSCTAGAARTDQHFAQPAAEVEARLVRTIRSGRFTEINDRFWRSLDRRVARIIQRRVRERT